MDLTFLSPRLCALHALAHLPRGSLPTEVCTVISDPTCEDAQNAVCDTVDVDETCLLTVRRAFNGSGTYCVNLTLGDDTSLALTSTLISVPDR
ncbi:hypothetical protein P7K49_025228, partial [Saguinus oedipus]